MPGGWGRLNCSRKVAWGRQRESSLPLQLPSWDTSALHISQGGDGNSPQITPRASLGAEPCEDTCCSGTACVSVPGLWNTRDVQGNGVSPISWLQESHPSEEKQMCPQSQPAMETS